MNENGTIWRIQEAQPVNEERKGNTQMTFSIFEKTISPMTAKNKYETKIHIELLPIMWYTIPCS